MRHSNTAHASKIPALLALMAIAAILAFTTIMTVSAQSDDPDWKVAPTGLVVAAGDAAGELDLTWDAHPQTTKTLSDYRVTWTPDGEDFKNNDQTDWYAYPTTNQVTVTGLDAGEAYKVRVRARYDDNKKSRWSQVQNGEAASAAAEPADSEPDPTPAPPAQNDKEDEEDEEETVTPRHSHLAAPTNLRVTNRTVNAITFAWNAPTDNDVTHTYIQHVSSGTTTDRTFAEIRTSFTVMRSRSEHIRSLPGEVGHRHRRCHPRRTQQQGDQHTGGQTGAAPGGLANDG